jgi:ATP-binding protein involved in chromosome partitioning
LTPARHAVAVASGKGGVGKSTVALNLALALAARDLRVGVLDADLYGPDIPLMVNLTRKEQLRRWDLWRRGGTRLEPVERFGLKIMSAGFLLAETQALAMPAPMLGGVLRQVVHDVDWGELDVLLVDLPPGTADVQQQLLDVLELAGALVVVGPQDVAHLDARKLLDFLRAADVRVLGGIENMSGLACPHCGEAIEVFPRVAHDRSVWAAGVEQLGRIPLDPAVATAGDRGRPVVLAEPEGAVARAFTDVAARVVAALDGRAAA